MLLGGRRSGPPHPLLGATVYASSSYWVFFQMKLLQLLSPSGSGRGSLFFPGTPLAVPIRLLASETLANIVLQKCAGRNVTHLDVRVHPKRERTHVRFPSPALGSPGGVLQLQKEPMFLRGLHQCLLGAHWVPGTTSRFCDTVIKGTSKNQVQ